MGVTNANKQINKDQIACDGTLKVTLAFSAAPDISTNPTDIVLVLDCSGSMSGSPMTNMKIGAKTFIDIIDESTDNAKDGNIGSGSRIGIVSFSGTAMINTPLITSTATLKDAIDSLTASSSTNHADAFTKATEMFEPLSTNKKVIVMFTDGKTTSGLPPAPIAAAARSDGIVIYCIGLIGSDGIDVSTLNEWATDPDDSHVTVTPNDADLEELFKDLASNISKTGATDITIDEVINPDFVITSVTPPSKGTAVMVNANTIQWKIPELGVSANEGTDLQFYIQHIAQDAGEKQVNQSITYSDNEGNKVIFPNPNVLVDCADVIRPEPCPSPIDITLGRCQDSAVIDVGDVYLESIGRILQLDATVKHVCPGKRVALAVILTELDDHNIEHARGMKTITIPAHNDCCCRDVVIKCIKFILPEDLDVSGGKHNALCNVRNFKARFIAHYIDTDFRCCDAIITMT
ncbi:MAG: VWA domain-containing protein [Clostridiales bacterium]|nr:VWA domain-containing protein [Clostridiales bacterium]